MILITAATAREIKALIRGSLTEIRTEAPFFSIQLGGMKLGFLTTGVGPLNAAVKLESLLAADPSVSGVVNVGIAGSYDPDRLPVGGVCLASAEVWPEYGVRDESGFSRAQELGFPLHGRGRDAVWSRIELNHCDYFACRGFLSHKDWHRGVSITVAGVTSLSAQAQALSTGWQASMENMEGFALAYSCLLRGIPFMEVRCISNPVGSRAPGEWDFPGAFRALGEVWEFWHKQIPCS
ncbi:MAG: futalosine hydrolase [Desulfonatronovibrionaceae bacterium]